MTKVQLIARKLSTIVYNAFQSNLDLGHTAGRDARETLLVLAVLDIDISVIVTERTGTRT